MRKLFTRSAVALATGTALYEIDKHYYARTFQRNLRTLATGLVIIVDYKLNFTPEKADKISALHTRVAERMYNVCVENAGLYIKFGQQLASMEHVAPPQYGNIFKSLYDDAPAVPFADVVRVVQEDFGKHPDELFDDFEREPIASASIAQVHRARMKGTGEKVAVKIQKPYIRPQLNWDLATYKLFLKVFETIFDLPMSWTYGYISKHMREEVDFMHEARNAERCAENLKLEPELAKKVYVPKVYWNATASRVMTSEWIDAVRFSNTKQVKEAGFSTKEVMEVTVDTFAHQIFSSRFVHCDPHPGNVLVRPMPNRSKIERLKRWVLGQGMEPQIVLLDHGLYIEESELFRKQYCMLWKSLFVQDMTKLESIAKSWGITDFELMASATLQRPYNAKKAVHIRDEAFDFADVYDMQVKAKERLRSYLSNTQLIPLELIFVGRNMNLVRANNKAMGSPVNRVSLMAHRAVQGLGSSWTDEHSEASILRSRLNYLRFQATLFVISVGFYLTRMKQYFGKLVYGHKGAGFEDLMEEQMKQVMIKELGMVVDQKAFDA